MRRHRSSYRVYVVKYFYTLLLLPFSMMKRPETEGITEKKTWERQSFPGKEREKRERKKQDDDEDAKTISSYTSPCFCLFLSLLSPSLSFSFSTTRTFSFKEYILLSRKRENERERRHPVWSSWEYRSNWIFWVEISSLLTFHLLILSLHSLLLSQHWNPTCTCSYNRM